VWVLALERGSISSATTSRALAAIRPARGLADLGVLSRLIPASGYVRGAKATSIDAGIYGFIANIHFDDIDTPLKQWVTSHPNLVRHCEAIHASVAK